MIYAFPVLILLLILALTFPAAAYQNPLKMPEDGVGAGVADPGILRYMGKYYLYATKVGGEPGIRCWESKDMVNWTFNGFCTGEKEQPVFAQGHGWSPGPFYHNGKFYLYVCSIDQKHRVFEADAPTGPFRCVAPDFLNVNSLDGVMFLDDDGQLYLFYAGWAGVGIQYRTCSSPTKADGPNQTLKSCQFSAENNGNYWTEGPALYKRDGTYYLCYCGNDWIRDAYQVQAAKGKSIKALAPQKTNPIISELQHEWVATGCNWVIIGPDLKSIWNVYHCRRKGAGERRLCLDKMHIDTKTGELLCDGPTWHPTPNPDQPTWSDDFARKSLGLNWTTLSGKWSVTDGRMACDAPGVMLCKVPTGIDFAAEFNLKLIPSATDSAKAMYGLSICRTDEGSLLVAVDVKSKSLRLLRESRGKRTLLKRASLPEAFTLDVWHTINIEKRSGRLTVQFDGMWKIDTKVDCDGSGFGFVSEGCRAAFGWCGFSNLQSG